MDEAAQRKRQRKEAGSDSESEIEDGGPATLSQRDAQVAFGSPEEIQRALDTTSTDLLVQGLTHLREHLDICTGSSDSVEARVVREGARRVVYAWADQDGSLEAIGRAWQAGLDRSDARISALAPAVVGRLVNVADAAETYPLGRAAVRLVLDGFMRGVHRAFTTARSAACAATLQLLRRMVRFGGGEFADELRRAIDWSMPALAELPAVRARTAGRSIRHLWAALVLEFFAVPRCRSARELLRTRGVVSGLFRGVDRDSYADLHALLVPVYDHIVVRLNSPRVLGVGLMSSLARAFRNNGTVCPQESGVPRPHLFVPSSTVDPSAGPITTDSPAALAARFFRGVMTVAGVGLSPRQASAADADGPLLRVLVACINPFASRLQADLATDVLRARTDLVAPFWRAFRRPVDPQLTLNYLAATAFVLKVQALPLPDQLPDHAESDLPDIIAPRALDRGLLGRGLQRASPLVCYRTLLMVAASLHKLRDVRERIQQAGGLASEGLDQRILAVVRQRMPEWKLVVAVHQRLLTTTTAPTDDREATTRHALIADALVRVMAGFHEHLPELTIAARFDLGRLLPDAAGASGPIEAATLLRLLRALPPRGVAWTSRVRPDATGAAAHTNIGVVLIVFLSAAHAPLRRAARVLAIDALCSTGLFEHAQSEPAAWLDALAALANPHALRGAHLTAGTPARATALVSFVEDALVHATRLPYKYADRAYAAAQSCGLAKLPFSPLLPAVAEAAILKAAVGSGALAARLRTVSPALIATEMATNPFFAFVREVACRIAAAATGSAAGLVAFVDDTARAVLAPRLAKLGPEASAERAHYENAADEADLPRRQAAFIAAIAWISRNDRLCLPGHSLWDHALAGDLALEIMQIDDLSFLDALFRHMLLSSASPCELLERSAVQRLLAHMLVAGRASSNLCYSIAQTLRWLVDSVRKELGSGSTDYPQTAAGPLAFVCALVSRHTASLVPAARSTQDGRDAYLLAQSTYADILSRPLLPECQVLQQLLDLTSAALVRQLADVIPSSGLRPVFWASFQERVVADALAVAGSTHAPQVVYALYLARYISAALSDAQRVELVGCLASVPEPCPVSVLCSVAVTVFALLSSGTAGDDADTRRIEQSLASRVIGLWASSLSANDTEPEQALEYAAVQAAGRISAAYAHSQSSASSRHSNDISSRAEAAKARLLLHCGSGYAFDADIDIASVLERQRQSLAGKTPAGATRWTLLSRILRYNEQLQVQACEWAAKTIDDRASMGLSQTRFLARLLCEMASDCSSVDAHGLVSWDDDHHALRIRSCSSKLGAAMFANSATPIAELTTSCNMLFMANAFIQSADGAPAAKRVCKEQVCQKPASVDISPGASLLRSLAIRDRLFPDTKGRLVTAALKTVMDTARQTIPDLSDASTNEWPTQWESVAALESAAEQCQQSFVAQTSISGPSSAVESVYSGVSALLESMEQAFEAGVDLSEIEVQRLATCYPPAVFRLLAFALQAAVDIVQMCKLPSTADLPWFSVLRRFLRCRLYLARIQQDSLRNPMALITMGLWQLSRPALSPWSASLDDYFQLDELETLVGAYSGSISRSDRALLQIIREYETTTRQSVQRVALAFGPVAAGVYTKDRINRTKYLIERDENSIGTVGEDTVAAALGAIDGGRMLRTIVDFPVYAKDLDVAPAEGNAAQKLLAEMAGASSIAEARQHTQVYDVQYILPWLWAVTAAGQTVDLRRLIECNAVGVAIAALSSSSERVRRLAFYAMDSIYSLLAEARGLVEKNQCLGLLDSLRNGIIERTQWETPQVPFTATLFVAMALPPMLHPEHSMYGSINRLVLKRPALRTSEVPLLRSILRSSMESRANRNYVLRLASQTARAFGSCAVSFRRGNVVNTMLALAASPLGDVQSGRAALTLLFHLSGSGNADVLAQYVSKSSFSLLTWIRGQAELEANSLRAMSAQTRTELATGNVAPSTHGVLAAIGNLAALVRIVARVVANYPLAKLGTGSLAHNKFWAVQSPEQPNAAGQSATIALLEQILGSLASALACLSGSSVDPPVAVSALSLTRTCIDVARLLADIQATAGAQQQPLALLSPRLAHSALVVVRLVEPAVGGENVVSARRSRPSSSIAQLAHAYFADMLFRVDEEDLGICGLYTACVDSLFAWTVGQPKASCHASDAIDITSRAMAAAAPSAANTASWIRDVRSTAQ
ncbi:hypothetical protein GGF46_002045 [Coemansia sp. RSA 552]|nr:hypothetical protein GGF46_002045 [Coemansia sp. RSA 552]